MSQDKEETISQMAANNVCKEEEHLVGDVNKQRTRVNLNDQTVSNGPILIAPQLRVEELRDDCHSSTGASDFEDNLSDIDCGRSPGVSDQEGTDMTLKDDQPFVEPSDELQEKIVKQVEFYFSDVNILKDAFLLKHVKRNKQGYVSLKLVTSFRKMKALTKDYRVVAFSLKSSNKLDVNEEKTKVRRKEPLPDYDETTPSRTVVAINLPFENPTIENVAELFSKCGEISLIRVLRPGKSLPPDIKKHLSKHPELGNMVCSVIEFENHLSAKTACETMTNTDDWRKGLSVTLLAVKKSEKNKNEKSKKSNGNHSSNDDQNESNHQAHDGLDEKKKKTARGVRKKGPRERTQGEGDNFMSSDDEQFRRNTTNQGTRSRSSLSPNPDMTHLTPSSTPRSTPKNTPKSSPRNSPSVNRRRTSHGKSPLAVDSLSPGTSPKPSPCVSPESLRRGQNRSEATPSPGCSPWLQRKRLQDAAGSKSPLVGSPMASPRIGRRLLDLEGVLRQPKGPDGSGGFYGGLGRGKVVFET